MNVEKYLSEVESWLKDLPDEEFSEEYTEVEGDYGPTLDDFLSNDGWLPKYDEATVSGAQTVHCRDGLCNEMFSSAEGTNDPYYDMAMAA